MEKEKVKVIIIEDEFVIAEDIRMKLEEYGYSVVATFDKGEQAFAFISNEAPDILLVDINLAGAMNGIELVKQLQAKFRFPFVYITANSDKATYERAKSTRPNAFLVKPFTSENLIASVDLAIFNFSRDHSAEEIERKTTGNHFPPEVLINQSLFVRTNGCYRKIHAENILFIEASGSYVHIQTTDQRYTLSQNLTHFQRKTPLANLIRIHRSFMININKVDSFDESYIFIQSYKLPFSDNFKADFLARIHRL